MISIVTTQTFDWVSLKDGIANEMTTVSIYFLGILIKRREIKIFHHSVIPDTKKPGF